MSIHDTHIPVAPSFQSGGGDMLFGEAPFGRQESLIYSLSVRGRVQTELKYHTTMFKEKGGGKIYKTMSFLGNTEVFDSEVTFCARTYAPVFSRKVFHLEGGPVEASVEYGQHRAKIHLHLPKEDTFSLEYKESVYDNEQIIHLLRTLDFEGGLEASFLYLYPFAKHLQTAFLKVFGPDNVTVDAGRFQCQKVALIVPGQRITVWYAENHPHQMVRYQSDAQDMVLELKSITG